MTTTKKEKKQDEAKSKKPIKQASKKCATLDRY